MKKKNKTSVRLVVILTIVILAEMLLLNYLNAKAETDTYIPQSQIELCQQIGAEYGIQPELLEAMIEVESSGRMSARNGSCYGIMQINGSVWGYSYNTESAQIRKACELLLSYNCEVDEALSFYNGQTTKKYKGYVEKVLDRAHELEVQHYGK